LLKFSLKNNVLKATFSKKHEFDYDVSDLGTYVDEQSEEVMQDLINAGNIKSRINVMQNVKGSEEIKLINSDPSLQAASSCGWNASGGMILTDVSISTVRVKIQEEYCNENLNETWAQNHERSRSECTRRNAAIICRRNAFLLPNESAGVWIENLIMNGGHRVT